MWYPWNCFSFLWQKRSWMSFLRNSNISAKIFSKNQECDKMTYGNCFLGKIASGENLKILGEA